MDRGASASWLTELLASTSSPCFLVDVYFDDGTISLTDAWRAVSYSGRTYNANGHFLNFTGLVETAALQVPALTLTLSSVDQTWVSVALTKPYLDRRLVIYKAFLDYTQALISSPVIVFDGRLDGMSIADAPDGSCTIGLTATSHWGDFYRKPGRHTNSQEQQVFFSTDKFFDMVPNLNRSIKWGAA